MEIQIRRNKEGNILYIDAWELVECSLRNGVLSTVEQDGEKYIPIYRNASESDPENYPEGWYLETKDAVIMEITQDEEGYRALVNGLWKKGIVFAPTFDTSILEKTEELMENHSLNVEEIGEYES